MHPYFDIGSYMESKWLPCITQVSSYYTLLVEGVLTTSTPTIKRLTISKGTQLSSLHGCDIEEYAVLH